MSVRILVGDVRDKLRELPDESVHTCVTSPPYWGLRDYGVDGQIGLEATPAEFVSAMVSVFAEVRRVLRPDGTCWINLGDSYASIGRSARKESPGVGATQAMPAITRTVEWDKRDPGNSHAGFGWKLPGGIKPKDLVGIPWRVAFALQADGWTLRQDIIWSKPNPMPESVRDRCTKAHEYIFLLAKSERYYYDIDAIAEPVAPSTVERLSQPTLDQQAGSDRVPGKTNGTMKAVGRGGKNAFRGQGNFRDGAAGPANRDGRDMRDIGVGDTRNKRSVWTVTTQPFKEAHFATFPPALIEPCILAGCPIGGTVLDPFFGAGTTGLVADRHGRNCIGIELNPQYAAMAHKRITNDSPLFADVA